LQALRPRFDSAEDRVLIEANIVRAAGGRRDREAFEEAWTNVENLLVLPQTAQRAAQALLSMARGATGLEEWERAEAAARSALERASLRGESQIVFEAESVLLSAQSHRTVAASTAAGQEELTEDAQV